MSKNNQFMQENSEAKEHKENLDNISHKSNLNQNEKMIIKSSNVFSIFHNENVFEIDTPIKNENETKKNNFCPFFGGQIYDNPTPEDTPNIKDEIDIFKGGQNRNELQTYENITKGGNIDNNLEKDKGYNNGLDNKGNNISLREIPTNIIDNNTINIKNINNIYNSNEGEDKEDKRNYQQDDNSELSNYYEYIKNYCEKTQRFPFFFKMDENEPKFILANKNLTFREILINNNIDVENIDLYCENDQKKVFLDKTIKSQNIRPFSYIQNNIN